MTRKSVPAANDLPSDALIQKWKAGDESAAEVLVDRYFVRLVALVSSRLGQRHRMTVDAEDITQSALGSFFLAIQQSKLQISHTHSLWNLLATFAKRKLLRRIERENALKRGGGLARNDLAIALQRVSASVSDVDADREWDELLQTLPDSLRPLAVGLMQGRTQDDLAMSLDVTSRTIRRRISKLRELLSIEEESKRSVFPTPSRLPRIEYRRFVLGKLIGTGGFSKVYRAVMQDDGDTVAVKFLRKGFWNSPEAKHAFLGEIEQAADLNHPNIIRYLGWGQSPHGAPYVVSELLHGRTMANCADSNSAAFVQRLSQLTSALDAVHQLGLVHGDVTPANVMIDHDGHLTLTDFGFAQSSQGDIAKESPMFGGTLGFAAPEQISSAFGYVSDKTDVYGVGAIAYWYLTARAPHWKQGHAESLIDTLAENGCSVPLGSDADPATQLIQRIATIALQKTVSLRPSMSELVEMLRSH